jgi:pyruvate formate lyase activating enzyme
MAPLQSEIRFLADRLGKAVWIAWRSAVFVPGSMRIVKQLRVYQPGADTSLVSENPERRKPQAMSILNELHIGETRLRQGVVHSIETFGSVDGPGVRFVVFLQGCRLRCRYCHNVDTWSETSDRAVFYSADELIKRALRYRPYWGKPDEQGDCGGITVSGGEPLLQQEFLLDLFRKAKEHDVHTCIDTAGEPFTRSGLWFSTFQRLMEVTDLLLVDLKQFDSKKHRNLTGKGNEAILDLLRYLDEIRKPVWIRRVLVPGVTDGDEELYQTRTFLETLTNVRRVEVLPYHAMAVFKWDRLGIPYTLREVNPPSAEETNRAQAILNGTLR